MNFFEQFFKVLTYWIMVSLIILFFSLISYVFTGYPEWFT